MSDHEAGTSIAVAVCTCRRNDQLRRLLEALGRNAVELAGRASVGVVIVDDDPEHGARDTCLRFSGSFPLGLHYRTAGGGNISLARNLAIETALPIADWVAMTDDDCEPVDSWLSTYVDLADATGAGALTGPCVLSPSATAPRWLTEQPFFADARITASDGTVVPVGATNNSFIRTDFLRHRPELRFDPSLGVVGGEDMVFFRRATAQGLEIRFSARSIVREEQPPSRETLRYVLRSRFWLGNTEYVTNRTLGVRSRPYWFARGCSLVLGAGSRPVRRLLIGRSPQGRYALAALCRGSGVVAGALGVKVRHH